MCYPNEKNKSSSIHISNNLSQKEAGERLGISQMHVSRLQRKAIKKLQQAILAAGGVS